MASQDRPVAVGRLRQHKSLKLPESQELIDLDYASLQASRPATDPFPHVLVPRFVPLPTLSAVVDDLPPIPRSGSFPVGSLRLGPAARALARALEGQQLREIVAGLFALDLSCAPTMLTVRGRTDEQDGQIHCDSKSKRVTALLYLNREKGDWKDHQGCLRLLRGPESLNDYAVEVTPVDGTLLVFPNGPTTWHGHKTFVGTRLSMQLNYMTTDTAAHWELLRHRTSAFLKRLINR